MRGPKEGVDESADEGGAAEGLEGKLGDVGLEDALLEPTIRTVACEFDIRFKEIWDAGRDVTLKEGGGDRSRMGVGTIGVGSVKSYAAAAFGEDIERPLGLGLPGVTEGDEDGVRSNASMGAV